MEHDFTGSRYSRFSPQIKTELYMNEIYVEIVFLFDIIWMMLDDCRIGNQTRNIEAYHRRAYMVVAAAICMPCTIFECESILFALHHELLTVNLQVFEFQIEIRVAQRLSHNRIQWQIGNCRIENNMKTNTTIKMGCRCIRCVCMCLCSMRYKKPFQTEMSVLNSSRVAQCFANGYAILKFNILKACGKCMEWIRCPIQM